MVEETLASYSDPTFADAAPAGVFSLPGTWLAKLFDTGTPHTELGIVALKWDSSFRVHTLKE